MLLLKVPDCHVKSCWRWIDAAFFQDLAEKAVYAWRLKVLHSAVRRIRRLDSRVQEFPCSRLYSFKDICSQRTFDQSQFGGIYFRYRREDLIHINAVVAYISLKRQIVRTEEILIGSYHVQCVELCGNIMSMCISAAMFARENMTVLSLSVSLLSALAFEGGRTNVLTRDSGLQYPQACPFFMNWPHKFLWCCIVSRCFTHIVQVHHQCRRQKQVKGETKLKS